MIIHIEKTTADNTIWLDNPIRATSIRLVSCDFVNKMMNLTSEGTISDTNGVLLRIPKGSYSTADEIKSIIDKAMFIGEKPVNIVGKYLIPKSDIILNSALAKLLNVSTNLKKDSKNEIQISPSDIYLHCDIIDPKHVMWNNKYSQVLAHINAKFNDAKSYNPEPLYIPARDGYINSIRFWAPEGLYPMYIVVDIECCSQ